MNPLKNFDIPPALKSFLKWLGQTLGTLAVFGVAATYWVNTEVERRMKELASDPGQHPVIVEIQSDVDNLEKGQIRIEGTVNTFSTEFMRYLQRQAELAEGG